MAIVRERVDQAIAIVAAGTVTAGTASVHQNLWGVYLKSGTVGQTIPFAIKGRFSGVTKTAGTGLTWTAGQKLYSSDNTGYPFKTTSTSVNTLCQNIVAGEAALAAATTGTVEIL